MPPTVWFDNAPFRSHFTLPIAHPHSNTHSNAERLTVKFYFGNYINLS